MSDVNEAAWQQWLEYRKAIKKPLREPSWLLARKKMAEMGEHQQAAVEHSIANGWQGLFLPAELRGTVGQQFKPGDRW